MMTNKTQEIQNKKEYRVIKRPEVGDITRVPIGPMAQFEGMSNNTLKCNEPHSTSFGTLSKRVMEV